MIFFSSLNLSSSHYHSAVPNIIILPNLSGDLLPQTSLQFQDSSHHAAHNTTFPFFIKTIYLSNQILLLNRIWLKRSSRCFISSRDVCNLCPLILKLMSKQQKSAFPIQEKRSKPFILL